MGWYGSFGEAEVAVRMRREVAPAHWRRNPESAVAFGPAHAAVLAAI